MEGFERWYRRSAHVFATVSISYYFISDAGIMGFAKRFLIVSILLTLVLLDLYRMKRAISPSGFREYETSRFGSYIYFGIGTCILLLLFPQQIAIPCIVSSALVDPVIGEVRRKHFLLAYLLGFGIGFLIFYSVWLTSEISIQVSLISASLLVLSELKKNRYLDDDLLTQIVPAIFLIIIYFLMGPSILPREIIPDILG